MSSKVPDSVSFEGQKDVPIYTFGQLSQQPRLKLKNRAMDLRDLIGADRCPPLNANGTAESVTLWILEVQCSVANSVGYELTCQKLGLPEGYGELEIDRIILGRCPAASAKSMPDIPLRQPMQELVQRPGAAAIAAYEAATAAAAAARNRNQAGSNIFG